MAIKKNFGLHLTLDLYECNTKHLSDLNYCFNILNELPELMGMNKLLPPIVQLVKPNHENGGTDCGGVSGFVMIAESHISLHTFIDKHFVTIDAYSCKSFDSEYVIQFFKNKFGSMIEEVNLIERGKKYNNY